MHVSYKWCYHFIMTLQWSSPLCVRTSSLFNHKHVPSKTTFLSTHVNTVHLKVSIAFFTMYKCVFPETFPQQSSTVFSAMFLHARSTFHAMDLSAISQESSGIFSDLMIVPDYSNCQSHGTDIAACLLRSFEGTWHVFSIHCWISVLLFHVADHSDSHPLAAGLWAVFLALRPCDTITSAIYQKSWTLSFHQTTYVLLPVGTSIYEGPIVFLSQMENEMSAGDYSKKHTIVTRPILCYKMRATMTSPLMARHKAVKCVMLLSCITCTGDDKLKTPVLWQASRHAALRTFISSPCWCIPAATTLP